MIARYTGDIITPLNEDRLRRLNLQSINNKKEVAMKTLEAQIEQQNNRKALRQKCDQNANVAGFGPNED